MKAEDEALERVFDHIGYLLNSLDPIEEVNKLVTLELTLNPDLSSYSYEEVMDRIVNKLANFYQDDEIIDLWEEYLFERSEDDAA